MRVLMKKMMLIFDKAKNRIEKIENTIKAQKELLEKAKLVQTKLNSISAPESRNSE